MDWDKFAGDIMLFLLGAMFGIVFMMVLNI